MSKKSKISNWDHLWLLGLLGGILLVIAYFYIVISRLIDAIIRIMEI